MQYGYLVPVLEPGKGEVAYTFWPNRNAPTSVTGTASTMATASSPSSAPVVSSKAASLIDLSDKVKASTVPNTTSGELRLLHTLQRKEFPPLSVHLQPITRNSTNQFSELPIMNSCSSLTTVPTYHERENVLPSSVISVVTSTASPIPACSLTFAKARGENASNYTSQESIVNHTSKHVRAKLVPCEIMSNSSVGLRAPLVKYVKTETISDKELTQWTAKNVADFIAATDCADNAQDFLEQVGGWPKHNFVIQRAAWVQPNS